MLAALGFSFSSTSLDIILRVSRGSMPCRAYLRALASPRVLHYHYHCLPNYQTLSFLSFFNHNMLLVFIAFDSGHTHSNAYTDI